jgi:16S rRNA (guanine1516-N2)-methyltransferase
MYFAMLQIDFLAPKTIYRLKHSSHKKELLARAIGIKHNHKPSVLDATAGLGRDGFLLAYLGCEVTLIERSPAIAPILRDALTQALTHPLFAHLKINLINTDAKKYLAALDPLSQALPDVIYLDPMYPHRTKSALVKKEMRMIRELVGDDVDAPDLLQLALQRATQRVVVKRPRLAAPLGDLTATFSIEGSQQRFDIYLLNI